MIMTANDPFSELLASGAVRVIELPPSHFPLRTRTLRPTSVEGLRQLMAHANTLQLPFYFVGGATSIQRTPRNFTRSAAAAPAFAISLELLNGVIDYRPMDFSITVEAGMRVAHLRETLAMRGQTIPLETPDIAQATIGGLLSSGRVGPRRRSLGRPRDVILGARLVPADGSVVDSGARTLRQASGYDLARLFVGSHGVLGAFATVTLRTRTLPEVRRCAVATLPEGTRDRAVASLAGLALEPTAALLIDGFERRLPGFAGPDGRLFLFFEGNEAAVSRATRELRTVFGAIGISETRIFDRETDAIMDHILDAPRALNSRESTAAIRLHGGSDQAALTIRERALAMTRETGVVVEVITDLQNDDVLARVRASGPRALEISSREIFIRLAGACARAELLDAPSSFRSRFDEAMPRAPESDLTQRLRRAFDPHGLCAVDRSTFVQ